MLEREALWILPLLYSCPSIFQILQKRKKKKEKIKAKPTLLHSSFIADNFIRCQEKQKIQTLNNSFTVIFGSRKWKTQQAGGEESFNIGICERQQ